MCKHGNIVSGIENLWGYMNVMVWKYNPKNTGIDELTHHDGLGP